MSGLQAFIAYRAARRVAGPCAAYRVARMQRPTPLPGVARDADAAWLVGWWQGKVVGVALGLAAAVLLGWLR